MAQISFLLKIHRRLHSEQLTSQSRSWTNIWLRRLKSKKVVHHHSKGTKVDMEITTTMAETKGTRTEGCVMIEQTDRQTDEINSHTYLLTFDKLQISNLKETL